MIALALVAAATAGTGTATDLADPSLWSQFGPFGIVFVVMVALGGGSIVWLLRERTRMIADMEKREATIWAAVDRRESVARADAEKREARLQGDIDERESRERDLYDRIIAQGDHFGPILIENTEALRRAIRTIDRLAQ